MSKVRINDLARELEVKSRPILDALEAIGVSGKTHSSSIEEDQAERVRAYFKAIAAPPLPGPRPPQTSPRFDLSGISKPGDAMRAILERKQAGRNAQIGGQTIPSPQRRPVVVSAPVSAAGSRRPRVAPPAAPVVARPAVVSVPVSATPPAATPAPPHPLPPPSLPLRQPPPPLLQPPRPAPHRPSAQPGRPHRRAARRQPRLPPSPAVPPAGAVVAKAPPAIFVPSVRRPPHFARSRRRQPPRPGPSQLRRAAVAAPPEPPPAPSSTTHQKQPSPPLPPVASSCRRPARAPSTPLPPRLPEPRPAVPSSSVRARRTRPRRRRPRLASRHGAAPAARPGPRRTPSHAPHPHLPRRPRRPRRPR